MAEAGRIDFDNPTSIDEEEDEETLAAIDEGIRDAEAGRTAPIEEVLKLLPKWIIASSSRKKLRNSLPAVIVRTQRNASPSFSTQ